MSITITAEQREALHELIIEHLSGIGDVFIATQNGDLEAAERLGREFADELRLLNDDLGWGEGTGEPVELRTPPELLRRVFERLLDRIAGQREAEAPQRAEARREDRRSKLVTEACARVLGNLGDSPRDGSS